MWQVGRGWGMKGDAGMEQKAGQVNSVFYEGRGIGLFAGEMGVTAC